MSFLFGVNYDAFYLSMQQVALVYEVAGLRNKSQF